MKKDQDNLKMLHTQKKVVLGSDSWKDINEKFNFKIHKETEHVLWNKQPMNTLKGKPFCGEWSVP